MVRVWQWQSHRIFFAKTKPEHLTRSCVAAAISWRHWSEKCKHND